MCAFYQHDLRVDWVQPRFLYSFLCLQLPISIWVVLVTTNHFYMSIMPENSYNVAMASIVASVTGSIHIDLNMLYSCKISLE